MVEEFSEAMKKKHEEGFKQVITFINQERFDYVLNNVNITETSVILDSGAAGFKDYIDPYLVNKLANKNPKLWLLDIEKENLDALVEKSYSSGTDKSFNFNLLYQSYLDPISTTDGKFDYIFSLGTLDHHPFDEVEKILMNYKSVLKDKGEIIFDYIASDTHMAEFYEKVTKLPFIPYHEKRQEYFSKYVKHFTPDKIKNSIINAGLKLKKTEIISATQFYSVGKE